MVVVNKIAESLVKVLVYNFSLVINLEVKRNKKLNFNFKYILLQHWQKIAASYIMVDIIIDVELI